MIRRTQLIDGREHWLLIAQIDHAHVAGRIAQAWSNLWPADASDGDASALIELVEAVFHHDDGWADWDAHPGVDPEKHRPRQFTEMLLDDSLAIWAKSIAVAERIGPLAALTVSGHFSALLRHVNKWQKTYTPDDPKAREFLAAQDRLCAKSLEAWMSEDSRHTPSLAHRAVELLQFFDAVSLWLCCAERHETQRMTTPDGVELILEPTTLAPFEQTISVHPWPLQVVELRLIAETEAVPMTAYSDTEASEAIASRPIRLIWRLVPSAGPA
ncbi:MAG TPA: DUF3891 family protein [Pirellulales bacterium]|jgi:hypothetical protein|nr:DUF3891 family protein [Pirellulales bacterium]